MPFTLASIQLASRLGEVEANLDRIAESLRQAASEGADVVLFPECIVSGYYLEGANLECALTPEALLAALRKRLEGRGALPDVALGHYELADGRPANSSSYLDLQENRVLHVHRKFFLPSYGVFDEARFCQAGNHVSAFDTRHGRFGMLICEDVWHSVLATLLSVQGADLILVPAASPGRGMAGDKPSNAIRYERMLCSASEEHGVYAASSGHVGFEGGKGLCGVGFIFDPFGRKLAESPVIGESIILAECDLDLSRAARAKSPLLSDLRSRWARIIQIAEDSVPTEPQGLEA
jgi:N-carbamoylputrescine amidase